jgi:hypothetical protein
MNHYVWLEKNLSSFFKSVGLVNEEESGIITAHGDKCYGYEDRWKKVGIPFRHGVAIFLLSYYPPYSKESRQTEKGWVPIDKWVIDNYARFKEKLPD